METIKLFSYLVILCLGAKAEENCPISDDEISKISDVLTHIDRPIYLEEKEDVDESNECAQLLHNIHLQLRRLTQKYKLMNKGYVKVEQFQKMAAEYDKQLVELNKELDEFKTQAQGNAANRVNELKKNIQTLEENVNKLHQDLKGVSAEYGEVQKALCITYLESNQISKAKDKVKHINSKYLIELIVQFLNSRNGSVLPVIDFSTAIPDLDDRGEAYKTIYGFIVAQNRLETDDCLLLEAQVLKMKASLSPESKITDDRKLEIGMVLQNLTQYSEQILNKWTGYLNQSENMVMIKNAIDHLFHPQMTIIGEKIGARPDYNSVRNFLKLLVLSNNPNKVAAYKKLIEKNVGQSFAMIWFDMISVDHVELAHDPYVSELFKETYEMLPSSLRNLRSCLNSLNIFFHQDADPKKCLVVTQKTVEVKHPKLHSTFGTFKEVAPQTTGCTRFRLESTSDKASVKIVSVEGNALTNINSAIPGNVWFSQVGAPYTNNRGIKLDSSQAWILEANLVNDTIKIESEFNAYQMGKSVDHLLVHSFGSGPGSVVMGRYGYLGIKRMSVEHLVQWKFSCAAQ